MQGMERTARTNTTKVFPVMEQCGVWCLYGVVSFLVRRPGRSVCCCTAKCQLYQKSSVTKTFRCGFELLLFTHNVTVFHLPNLNIHGWKHTFRNGCPSTASGSQAVQRLEAGSVLGSPLCPLELSFSDALLGRMPTHGEYCCTSLKRSSKKAFGKAASNRHLLNEAGWHTRVLQWCPCSGKSPLTSGHGTCWSCSPSGAGAEQQLVLGAGLLCSPTGLHQVPHAAHPRARKCSWPESLGLEAAPPANGRAFPFPPPKRTGKFSSSMARAHLSLAYK